MFEKETLIGIDDYLSELLKIEKSRISINFKKFEYKGTTERDEKKNFVTPRL